MGSTDLSFPYVPQSGGEKTGERARKILAKYQSCRYMCTSRARGFARSSLQRYPAELKRNVQQSSLVERMVACDSVTLQARNVKVPLYLPLVDELGLRFVPFVHTLYKGTKDTCSGNAKITFGRPDIIH